MIPKNELDKLRDLVAAGDQGPWEADIDEPGTSNRMWTGKFYIQGEDQKDGRKSWCPQDNDVSKKFKHACNAELVAAAVTVLPGLLNFIEHMYMELFEVTAQRDSYKRQLKNPTLGQV
jgi:hypothetical protein